MKASLYRFLRKVSSVLVGFRSLATRTGYKYGRLVWGKGANSGVTGPSSRRTSITAGHAKRILYYFTGMVRKKDPFLVHRAIAYLNFWYPCLVKYPHILVRFEWAMDRAGIPWHKSNPTCVNYCITPGGPYHFGRGKPKGGLEWCRDEPPMDDEDD